MIKIALLGIAVALIALPFKVIKGEYSLYIGLAGCLMIFLFIVGKLEQVIVMMEEIGSLLPIDGEYIRLLIKMIGITYVTEFSQDICKDAGFGAVANQIGIAGKITLLVLGIPVIQSLLSCLSRFGG